MNARCTLQELAHWSNGQMRQGVSTLPIQRLHTDSRTLQQGDCFVALRGDRFDAHDFVGELPARGAVAAMVSRWPLVELPPDFGVVQVADSLTGLQKAAAAYRRQLSAKIVGITGSSGKTTTKELVASVLRQKYHTQATQGNLNNHIGVPLTLFQLQKSDEFGVVEMGMNHPGEIAPLAQMAAPDMAIITNIGTAHIEFFPDQAGIAQEKSEIIAALEKEGVAILNADDPWSEKIKDRTPATIIWVGSKGEWRAEEIALEGQKTRFYLCHAGKKIAVTLPLLGRQMVSNALLAAAAGGCAGLTLAEIAQGLEAVTLPGKRMELVPFRGGWLINDAYNANADSMKAGIASLQELPCRGRKIAVLGSMGELGHQAEKLHHEVGRAAAQAQLEIMIFVGPQASVLRQGAVATGSLSQMVVVPDAEAAAEQLQGLHQEGDNILIKGSRFLRLEKVVELLGATGEKI